MFGKSLKHDLSSVKRPFFISSFIMVLTSFLGAICNRYAGKAEAFEKDETVLYNISVIITILTAVCAGIYFLFNLITVGKRFYSSFYTDQAYLTFTLPVKRSHLLLSKTLTASIVSIGSSIFVGMYSLIRFLFSYDRKETYKEYLDLYKSEKAAIGGQIDLHIAEYVLIALAGLIFLDVLIFSIETLVYRASQKKKNTLKLFLLIICVTLIGQCALTLFLLPTANAIEGMFFVLDGLSSPESAKYLSTVYAKIILALLCFTTLLYLAICRYFEHKLDLQ